MPYNEEASIDALKNILKTVARLRAPNGCPWDREQTHQSLRPHLVEEAYEVIEVLDQIKSPEDLKKSKIRDAFVEEWGDVLLQILLHAEIASENDPHITFQEIATTLNEKLIRRHPHVFGNTNAETSAEVIKNWDEIKKSEKGAHSESTAGSILDEVSKGLPPLPRTMKLIKKVTKVGFQWPDLSGPLDKLSEEVTELKDALKEVDHEPEEYLTKAEAEIGDVLFSVCNIAYFLKIDPETALRQTLQKFESRFRYVESRLTENGKSPQDSSLEEMDTYWNEAKKMEQK